MIYLLHCIINISNIPPSYSMNFSTLVPSSLDVRLSLSSRFIMRKVAPKMRASFSFRVSTFLLKLRSSQPHKQISHGVRSGDSNSTVWASIQNYKHKHIIIFFSQSHLLSPPKLLTAPESLRRFVIITYYMSRPSNLPPQHPLDAPRGKPKNGLNTVNK